MTAVTLDSRPVLASSVVPEALSSCCAYLLERISQIWQAVCAWLAHLFGAEAAPLPSFPKPLPEPLVLQILKFSSPEINVSVGKTNKFFNQAFKKWHKQLSSLDLVWDDKFDNSLQDKIFSSTLPGLRTLTLSFPQQNVLGTFIDKKTFIPNLLKYTSQLTALHLKAESQAWRFDAVFDTLREFTNLQEVSLETDSNEQT